jgi:hypothetical protein
MEMMPRSLEKAKGLTPNNRGTLVSRRSGGMIKRASSTTVCSEEIGKKKSLANGLLLCSFAGDLTERRKPLVIRQWAIHVEVAVNGVHT